MLAQGISLAASAHLAVDHTRLGAAGRAGLPQGGTGTDRQTQRDLEEFDRIIARWDAEAKAEESAPP
jgi:hypothetical protein